MSRPRQVFPTDQVIHIWAHQTQPAARNGSNVSFDGKLLYSYSTVIAQLEKDLSGNVWAFLSSESLTPTTSKHIRSSRSATRHLNRFLTPAFASWSSYSRNISEMINPAIKQAKSDLAHALRPGTRKITKATAQIDYQQRYDEIKAVSESFGIPFDMPEINDNSLNSYIAEIAELKKIERSKELARTKERQQEDLEQFTAWLTLGTGYFPSSFRDSKTDYFTIRDNTVVTSRGAQAPLDHVIHALKFYELKRWPYHTNGHTIHLGNFKLDSIDIDGNVKAGCHTFTAETIANFRAAWGV